MRKSSPCAGVHCDEPAGQGGREEEGCGAQGTPFCEERGELHRAFFPRLGRESPSCCSSALTIASGDGAPLVVGVPSFCCSGSGTGDVLLRATQSGDAEGSPLLCQPPSHRSRVVGGRSAGATVALVGWPWCGDLESQGLSFGDEQQLGRGQPMRFGAGTCSSPVDQEELSALASYTEHPGVAAMAACERERFASPVLHSALKDASARGVKVSSASAPAGVAAAEAATVTATHVAPSAEWLLLTPRPTRSNMEGATGGQLPSGAVEAATRLASQSPAARLPLPTLHCSTTTGPSRGVGFAPMRLARRITRPPAPPTLPPSVRVTITRVPHDTFRRGEVVRRQVVLAAPNLVVLRGLHPEVEREQAQGLVRTCLWPLWVWGSWLFVVLVAWGFIAGALMLSLFVVDAAVAMEGQ